jgi:hypothetical protein
MGIHYCELEEGAILGEDDYEIMMCVDQHKESLIFFKIITCVSVCMKVLNLMELVKNIPLRKRKLINKEISDSRNIRGNYKMENRKWKTK